MSNYLWDRSGEAEPDVERLERVLARHRHDSGPRAAHRRPSRFGLRLVSGLVALAAASGRQILAVTHSPQVAAVGSSHWLVSKNSDGDAGPVVTRVESLDSAARQEEIARMLAGAQITDEARAAAERLLVGVEPQLAASPRDAA